MTQLNTEWMLTVLRQAMANAASGSPIFVGDFPEIEALKQAGLLKVDKRKKGEEEGTFYATATEQASEAAFYAAFPPVQVQEAAPAPAAPAVTDYVPQFEPATQTAPVEQQAAPAPAPAPALAPAPAVQEAADAVVIGADATPTTVDTATIGDTQFAIQTGIAFVKHKPKPPARKEGTVRQEKYPFSVLAKLKLDNMNSEHPDDNFIPSFHVAGAVTKNFSGNISRANEGTENNAGYEKTHGVTFRATQAAPNDPCGEGVRVFCMSLAQAPARQQRKAKTTEQVEQTPVA